MTELEPGDRVIICDGSDLQGRIAVVSDDSVKVFKPSKGIVYVKLGRFHVPFSDYDLRPAFQTCKDCDGSGEVWGINFDGAHKYAAYLNCDTCDSTGRINRTGPYRLADGTWSDGVKRTARIEMRAFGDANPDRVRVLVCPTCFDKPGATVLHRGSVEKCFPTHAEAIAYADRMAGGGA